MKMDPMPQSVKKSSKPDKFCPGCGHSITLKTLGIIIDELKISHKTLIGVDIGCSLLAWDFFDVPTLQTHHGRTVPVITGYKKVEPEKVGIAYVGDGGAYAIGLQALITAANRNDPITVIVINNTLYGMTGGQMAPTTLDKEITTTTPSGKNPEEKGEPLLGPELLSCLQNKKMFIARAMITKPLVVKSVIEKAIKHQMEKNSFAFVEILSMCPTNWKKDAKDSIDFVEKDMQSVFKLKELSNGK
jgi:2-oxoglutarate/2-oxoacid ferredoxin oxidoreductase subunit beta